MERKHYVKCCELIIADRYWLAGHFFAADSSELAIWLVSCLSQVIGIGWGLWGIVRIHTEGYTATYTNHRKCIGLTEGGEDGKTARRQNRIDGQILQCARQRMKASFFQLLGFISTVLCKLHQF